MGLPTYHPSFRKGLRPRAGAAASLFKLLLGVGHALYTQHPWLVHFQLLFMTRSVPSHPANGQVLEQGATGVLRTQLPL